MYLTEHSLRMAKAVLKPQCSPKADRRSLGASVTLPPSAYPMPSCRVTKGRWDFPDPPHSAETHHQCGNDELINKQTGIGFVFLVTTSTWTICRMETPIIKSTAYYAKVEIALSQSIARELLFAALIALAASFAAVRRTSSFVSN
jgi:hypothetical protein